VDIEAALPVIDCDRPLKPARNPPVPTFLDYFPMFRLFAWIWHKLTCKPTERRRRKNRRYHEYVESNVPLEIILVLSNYTGWCMKNGLLQPAIATAVTTNLSIMQDTLSNLERICNTPLPFAYQAHLRMSLWLYLFFLPFQIYQTFKWMTIPGTAFAAFLLLGFLEIGQEIENPFNYDLNDLDLDYFCSLIQRELHLITAYSNPSPHDFLFTDFNQPFAPADRRTAKELVEGGTEYRAPPGEGGVQPGWESIKHTLVKGWKDVEELTRFKET